MEDHMQQLRNTNQKIKASVYGACASGLGFAALIVAMGAPVKWH